MKIIDLIPKVREICITNKDIVSLLYEEILISEGLDGEKVHSEKLTEKIRILVIKFNLKLKNQFQYLLIRSDPEISSINFIKHKSSNGNPLSEQVLNLLKH